MACYGDSFFSFQAAPQLSHEAERTPFQSHYYSENVVAPGNWTRNLWVCSQELWPLDHRGGRSLNNFFYWNLGQPRTLLQLKLVGMLTINLFLT
jgi:hypothetical protein